MRRVCSRLDLVVAPVGYEFGTAIWYSLMSLLFDTVQPCTGSTSILWCSSVPLLVWLAHIPVARIHVVYNVYMVALPLRLNFSS